MTNENTILPWKQDNRQIILKSEFDEKLIFNMRIDHKQLWECKYGNTCISNA